MRNTSVDPDGYGPSDIVQRLHRCVETGYYGIDYTIKPRDKNELLLEKYIMTEADRIDILRKLSVADYDGWDVSDNTDFSGDIVHFFHYETALMLRGVEDAASHQVRLYIKISWVKPECVLIVISFHE